MPKRRAADSERKNVIFIVCARGGRRYIFIGQRPIMADDADNGLAEPQDFDRRPHFRK